MLLNEDDIAATHELFKHLNGESHEYIQRGNYTLILDEVLDVISPYNLKSGDLKLLTGNNWVTIDEDGFLIWNDDVPELPNSFEEVKRLAENHSLVCVNGSILLWRYPPEIFSMFNKIYIMTYLFESSIMCAYFKYNGIEYEKKSIKKTDNGIYKLCDFHKFDASIFAPLVNIYEGPLNTNVSNKSKSMSKTWFNNSNNTKSVKQLKDNVYNYFRHILNVKADRIMWTCFKDDVNRLRGNGYTKSHVSCTCRSTNNYADRDSLAYTINRFLNPCISAYFDQKNIKINEDLYALSEMIQWIWRSQIRNGKPISIYVSSDRMRNLLQKWLRGVY